MEIEFDKWEKVIAIIQIIGACLIVLFWIGWILGIIRSVPPTDNRYWIYVAFESTFPVPDFWIVILLILSAFGLLLGKAYARILSAGAGGALVFLGLIDANFNILNGIYFLDPLAILINLACVAGGGFLLAWFVLRSYIEEEKRDLGTV